MTNDRRRRPLRALALQTALGTSLAVFANSALAQVDPRTVPIGPSSNRADTTFQTVANPAGGQTLTVDLNNRASTIINWRGFDIGANSVANFVSTDGRTPNLTDQFSVLNRVFSGNPTNILGQLTSQPNIAVFLLNGSGILFGRGSTVATGGFVASTLDIRNRDFTNGTFRFELGRQGSGSALFAGGGPITVEAGASLASTGKVGQLRGVVLVSPTITSNGAVDGGKGDVAFVAAADVTLSYTTGSPLGISIARGLPVQASQVIGGTVNGQSVYLALATQAEATASLLQIDGDVRAVGTGNGVVIVGGRSDAVTPGVTFTRNADGPVRVATSAGSSLASRTDITLATLGDADLAGTARAGGDVTATIAGAATIGGDTMAATGDLSVTAASIDAARLRAGGALRLEALKTDVLLGSGQAGTTATLIAASDLAVTTLKSGSAATLTAGRDATIGLVSTIDGAISVTAASGSLNGGSGDGGALLLAGGAGNGVTVDAGRSVTLDRATGTGDLSVTAAAGSIVANRLLGDRVTLSATGGNVTLGTATATSTMTIAATGSVDAGPLDAGANLIVDAGGSARLAQARASGTLRVGAQSIDIDAATAGDALSLRASAGDLSLGTGSAGTSLALSASGAVAVGGSLAAGTDVIVGAGGGVTLQNLVATTGRIRVVGQSVDLSQARAGGGVVLRAAAGDLTSGPVTAGASMLLGATGAVSVAGGLDAQADLTVTAGGAVTAGDVTARSGNLSIAGASLDLGDVAAGGRLTLTASGGDLLFGSGTAAGAATLSATGRIAASGAFTAVGDLSVAAGAGARFADVTSTTGGITIGAQAVNLASASAGTSLRLDARAGNLLLGTGQAASFASLSATGSIGVTRALTAGTDLAVDAGRAARLGDVLAGSGNLTVRARQIALDQATAGGALLLQASAGGVALNGATAGAQATLIATRAITLTGPLTAGGGATVDAGRDALLGDVRANGGDLTITGRTVALGDAFTSGALTIAASRGGLTLASGTAGRDATLSATGDVAVAGALDAGTDASVRSGGSATLTDVIATTGDVRVSARSVALVSATAGDELSLAARTGALTLGTGSAGSSARLTAATDINVAGPLAAGTTLTAIADGGVALDSAVTTSGDVLVRGLTLRIGRAVAGDTLRLEATGGDLELGSGVAGGSALLRAPGDIAVAGRLAAGDAVHVTSGGGVTIGNALASSGDLIVRAAGIDIGRAVAGDRLGLTATILGLSLGSGSAGGSASLFAAGDLDLTGPLVSGGAASLTAGGSARIGSVTANAGAIAVTARDVVSGPLTAAGALSVAATGGEAAIRSAAAGGVLRLSATGALAVGTLDAGASAIVTAGDRARIATATTGRGLRVDAATISIDAATTGGTLALTATAGDVALANGIVGGTATLDATGDVTVASALTSRGDATITAGGTARLGVVLATSGGIAVTARTGAVVGVGGNDGVLITQGRGNAVTVTAAGRVALDLLAATGDATVTGGTIAIDAASSGGALALTSTTAGLSLGTGDAGTGARLQSAADLAVRTRLTTGGAATLVAGGDARVASIVATGGAIDVTAGGEVTGFGATERADLAATGRDPSDGPFGIAVTTGAGRRALLGAVSADGDIAVTAGTIDILTADAGKALLLRATAGSLTLGSGSAGSDAQLTATRNVAIGGALVGGRDASVDAGGSVTAAGIAATTGGLRVTAGGDVAGVTADGVALTAGGARGLGVTAGGSVTARQVLAFAGDLAVDAGSAARLDRTAATGNVTVTVAGDGVATLGSIVADGGVGVSAGDISADRVIARTGDIAMTARTGGLDLRSGQAGGVADYAAAGDLATGSAGAGGTLSIRSTGGDVAIGTARSTGGAISVSARTGAVTGQDGNGAALAAGGADGIDVRARDAAMLGDVRAEGTVRVAVEAGSITAGDIVSHAGSILLRATGGDLAFGNGFADDDIRLFATDDITALRLRAGGDIAVDAGGLVTIGRIDASAGSLRLSAAALDLGRASAARALVLTATAGALSLDRGIAGGIATLTAATDLDVSDALIAGSAATIVAGGDARIAAASSRARDVTITAASIDIGRVTARGALSLVTTAGDLALGTGRAGTTATLDSFADLTVAQSLTSGDATTLTAGGDARLGSVMARDGAVDLTTGGFVTGAAADTGATLVAAGFGPDGVPHGVLVRAAAAARFDAIVAAGDIDVAAASIRADGIVAGRRSEGSITTRGSVTLDAAIGGILLGTASATADFSAVAADAITATRLTAERSSALTGRAIDVGTAIARTGALTLTGVGAGAQGTIGLRVGSAGDAVTITGRGAVSVGTLTSGADATITGGNVATATLGAVAAKGDVRVAAGSIDAGRVAAGGALVLTGADPAGSVRLGTSTAGTTARIDAAGGATVSTSLTSGGDTAITAGDRALASLGRIDAGGDLSVRAGSIDGRTAITRAGALTLTGVDAAGSVALGTGTAATTATIAAAGGISVRSSLTSGDGATITAGGAASLAAVESGAGLAVDAASIDAGLLSSVGAMSLIGRDVAGTVGLDTGSAGTTATIAGAGAITVGALTSGADATITGGAAALTTLVSVKAGGALTVTSGSIDAGTLTAVRALSLTGVDPAGFVDVDTGVTLGDLFVTGGSIDAGAVNAGGALSLVGVDANGLVRLDTGFAGLSALIESANDVTVTTSLTSGGDATVTGGAAGLASVARIDSGAGVAVTAGSIDAGAIAARSGLSLRGSDLGGFVRLGVGSAETTALIEGGDMSIGDLTSGGAATVTGGRLELSGVLTAATLTVAAGDVDLGPDAAVRVADAATFTNSATAAGMTLGEDLGGAGFSLANEEIGRIHAPALVFDGGAGGIELRTITLGADTGSKSLAFGTTGDIMVTGAVSAPTSGRSVALAGANLRVLATVNGGSTGGGRLDFDGASLDLSAERIAVGQSPGFVDALFSGLTPQQVADRYVSNSRSTLYNAAAPTGVATGMPYRDAPTLIRAESMTVRYSQFALFQNTGQAVTGAGVVGTKAGVVLGSPGSGLALTLRSTSDSGGNAFAMFGTIGSAQNEAAALVGEAILSTKVAGRDTIVIQNSRVNGCIIGTGGGCLTTPIGIPPINIFDASRLNVFVPADFEVAFDPLVGSNNESLFAGISALDVPVEGELQFDPNIGGNNEALFTGDQADDQPQCPAEKSDKPCPPKEDRR